MRMKAFLHALGSARAARLVRLLAAHDLVLDRLLEPQRLSTIRDPAVLAKVAKLTGDLIDSDVAFLERRAADNTDQVFAELSRQAQVQAESEYVKEFSTLTPQQRGQARSFLQRLYASEAKRQLNEISSASTSQSDPIVHSDSG